MVHNGESACAEVRCKSQDGSAAQMQQERACWGTALVTGRSAARDIRAAATLCRADSVASDDLPAEDLISEGTH